MKKLGIVITDGVGFRNFVLSNFLKEAELIFDEIIIYSGLVSSVYRGIGSHKIKIKELPIYKESKIDWIFRKLKEVAHLYLHQNYYGVLDNLKRGYPTNNSFRALQIKFIYLVAHFFHQEKHIKRYEKWQFKSFGKNNITKHYIKLLSEDQPDMLFFTHQRPPYVAPILYAAQQLQIKTATFIFSWDNLASKGRMLGTFDYHLVWSTLMKRELKHFYPRTVKETIQIVGTPQFESYVLDSYKVDKTNFVTKFGLDATKKIICYSCADAGIGGNDPHHIASIMKFIELNDSTIQLLVRTSPAEDGKRFETIKTQFPKIKWNFPKWNLKRSAHVETWSQRVPTEEDLVDLKSILSFCDVNVNMCSTMSLDFMLFDKPVINTVFGTKENGLYNDQRFLNFDHYKKVVKSGAVAIAKNEDELFRALNTSLANPLARLQQQKELLKLQISKPLKGTSKRIALQLKEWSES